MGSLIRLESIQYSREWALWTALLAGFVVMGLAFYPAISGSIGEISVLFDHPLMGTVLAAFGADAQTLGSLSGFFETYASIYVTLLGCIYAALGGSRRLAREEQNGTAEYLLTRPVSRPRVYWTKLAVLVVHLAALSGVVLLASFASLEAFGRNAPPAVHASARTVRLLADAFEDHPGAAPASIRRDRALFERALVEAAATQVHSVGNADLRGMGIDRAALLALVDQLGDSGPMDLLDDVEAHPERYRELFGVADGSGALSSEEIVAGVRERRAEIEAMWAALLPGSGRFHEVFRLAPRTYLEAMAREGSLPEVIDALELPPRWYGRITAPYSHADVVANGLFAFLAMVLFASVGVVLSVAVRSPEVASGGAVAYVLVAYFIDVITSAAGAGGALRWLSPIAMIDGAPGRAAGSSGAFALGAAYYVVLAGVIAVIGARLYRRRDVYVP